MGSICMYAMIKETLRILGAPDIGGVREPLYNLVPEDKEICRACAEKISALVEKYA